MLMHAEHATLLIIDLQERLVGALDQGAEVVAHATWLLGVAARLDVPVLATEQYPRGLGRTVAALATLIPPGATLEKLAFSAAAEPALPARLTAGGRRQCVIAGAEAHVCVLQTALGLRAQGFEVFLVAEAVGSRRTDDKALGLQRARDAGCSVVSREMVAFEWLERAGTDTFRAVSRDFIR